MAASVVYGAADFLGGLASRRSTTLAVAGVSQIVGLMLLMIAAPLLSGAHAAPAALAWGAAAGVGGGLGIALLYRALASGRMSVVAPVTAVCAITVPVLAGMMLGERLPFIVLAGVVLAMGAIVLISQEGPARLTSGTRIDRSLLPALFAGVAIGAFYVCLERAGADAGLWPLLAARSVSVTGFAGAVLLTKRSFRLAAGTERIVVATGVLDVLANALYVMAVREGMLSVVATLSSLYPAATVVLAYLVLGERLRWVQGVGLGVALVAVVMIAG